MRMTPLDPDLTIHQQLAGDAAGSIVLMNVFTMDAADEDAFLASWQADAAFMKARPGFIATQLHRAVGPRATYYNHAVWESVDAFRAAFGDSDFRTRLASYPASVTGTPHLFRRVAVPGICVA